MKQLLATVVMCVVFATGVYGQSRTNDTAATNFIRQAAVGGMKEVKEGKLAETKSPSPGIRAFGKMMVNDHSTANDKLMRLVHSKGYNIQTPTSKETAPDRDLADATRTDFDRNYVKAMIRDHEKTIALFQQAESNIRDPAVQSFAKQTLPVLQRHLVAIRRIASKMKIDTNQ